MLVSCTSLIAAPLHGFRSLFIFYSITFRLSNYIVSNIRVRLLLYHLKDKCELYISHKELIGILKAEEQPVHMLNKQVLFLYFTALKKLCHFFWSENRAEPSIAPYTFNCAGYSQTYLRWCRQRSWSQKPRRTRRHFVAAYRPQNCSWGSRESERTTGEEGN